MGECFDGCEGESATMGLANVSLQAKAVGSVMFIEQIVALSSCWCQDCRNYGCRKTIVVGSGWLSGLFICPSMNQNLNNGWLNFLLKWKRLFRTYIANISSSCFRSIHPAEFQIEDVFSVSQDRVCGGPLSLHGRVQSAAGGMWRGDKESSSGAHSFGPRVQVPLDLCCGMLHGVLPDTVWYLSKGQTGQLEKKKKKERKRKCFPNTMSFFCFTDKLHCKWFRVPHLKQLEARRSKCAWGNLCLQSRGSKCDPPVFVALITLRYIFLFQLMSALAAIGPPNPREDPECCSILHGLVAAVESLCKITELQHEKRMALMDTADRVANRGRIICLTDAKR